MKRTIGVILVGLLLLVPMSAIADHSADEHVGGLSLHGRFDAGGQYRLGTDLAFWGDLAVLGNFDQPGGFRLLDISNPRAPRQVGQFVCPGSQADVSIWEDLAFVSVDAPRAEAACTAGAASRAQVAQGTHWEGIRIVSISDPARPRQIAAVTTDCGSHTHTLVPDPANNRLLIYVLSYPLGPTGVGARCSYATHSKISVIEVPLARPETAEVIATPTVAPAIGCHDVTVFVPRKLAAAACITETQLWDITDPARPQVVAHITNPLVNIHHSTTFSWDAKTLVIGDELGGAAASPGCLDEHLPLGALWFYDVSDPSSPVRKGSFTIGNDEVSAFCTAHNFNVVPQLDRDILISAWYNGGTVAVDFTDPSAPKQLAFFTPKRPFQAAAWSSYWYNGFVYVNNFDEDVNSVSPKSRGFDVLAFDDPAVNGAAELTRLNPQTMEALPAAPQVKPARFTRDAGPVLPRTGLGMWIVAAAMTIAAGALLRRWVAAGR